MNRALVALLAPLCAPAASAQFVEEPLLLDGGAPFDASYTDNIDFGDIDLDGDFDVAMADGGDCCNDQNRIWVNQGGLQAGVVGTFRDETDAQAPAYLDDSRDVEFADIDADADLDLYVSNTAQLVNQGNRWWINQGGRQGGALGFYADETAAHWVDLGGGSIAPTLLLPNASDPETFIDWSCDSDFGDLDADGDLDLLHTTYGGAFGGQSPTRIFLNDGDGHFEELNPSGFQLASSVLPSGSPGLWCEGVQTPNTTVADGSECDIALGGEDADIGDFDGDLDLDILHGDLFAPPRMFSNRLEETGTLVFRDVTGAVFPPGYVTGNGHFEQEMGDLDGDADLDILGVNWLNGTFAYEDVVLENLGGVYAPPLVLPSSGADDNEGDLVDFDNDGDLDILIANFSGKNRLYENEGSLVFADVSDLIVDDFPRTTFDADVADVDDDGDYDFVEGNMYNASNRFFVNQSDVPDTHAPQLAHVEAVVGHGARVQPDRVRMHVYDNAPYYVTYTNTAEIEVTVQGSVLPPFRMTSSGGQVFRGEVPGNLVGDVSLALRCADRYGNTGTAPGSSYANQGPTGTLQGGTSPGPLGTPTIHGLTSPFPGAPLAVAARNATPGALGVFLVSTTGTLPGLNLGDGAVLNVLPPFVGSPVAASADANGALLLWVPEVSPSASGVTAHVQALVLDGVGGSAWSSTKSLSLAF